MQSLAKVLRDDKMFGYGCVRWALPNHIVTLAPIISEYSFLGQDKITSQLKREIIEYA